MDIKLQEQIMNAKDFDFDVKNAISISLEDSSSSIRSDLEDWKLEDNDRRKILFYKGKVYVPKHQELRHDILKLYHDLETAGYPGKLEIYNSV